MSEKTKRRMRFMATILGLVVMAAAVVTNGEERGIGVRSVDCIHEGHHYQYLEPTYESSGHHEFWVCCKCNKTFLADPGVGTFVDKEASAMVGWHVTSPAYIGKKEVIAEADGSFTFVEINDDTWVYKKANKSATNWFVEATINNITDLLPQHQDTSIPGLAWRSLGVGSVDKDGRVMMIEPQLDHATRPYDTPVQSNFAIIDNNGGVIKQMAPWGSAGNYNLFSYTDHGLKLAVWRDGDLYNYYANGRKLYTASYTGSLSGFDPGQVGAAIDYDATVADFPALVSKGIGANYSNVQMVFDGDNGQTVKEYVHSKYVNIASDSAQIAPANPALSDITSYATTNSVSFGVTNQSTNKYPANLTLNYVGKQWGLKAKFSGFDRTATDANIMLGVKAGDIGSKGQSDWGNTVNLYFCPGSETFGFRTDLIKAEYNKPFAWPAIDRVTNNCDCELEIRWIQSVLKGRVTVYHADGTSTTSAWNTWDLTTNGYFGQAAKGYFMAPTINSFHNPVAGTVSEITFIPEQYAAIL